MNSKLFKSVWNTSLGDYVAVAENAKNHVGGQSIVSPSQPREGRRTLLTKCFPLRVSVIAMGMVSNLFSYSVEAASCATQNSSLGVVISLSSAVTCTVDAGTYTGDTNYSAIFTTGNGVNLTGSDITIINNNGRTGAYGLLADTDSTMIFENVTINATGSRAVLAQRSGQITLTGFDILNFGASSYAAAAASGGTINLANGTIATSGTNGHALYLSTDANGHINASDLSITTTGATSHGVFSQSNGDAHLTNASIVTGTNGSFGLYALGGGSSALITLDGQNTVTTSGVGAHGLYATGNNANIQINSGTTDIVANGNASSSVETHGVSARAGGHVTTAAGSVLNIDTHGGSVGTIRTYGVMSSGTGSLVTLNGTTNITTSGFNGFGIRGEGGGHIDVNGDLNITTAQGPGVQSDAPGTIVTLAGETTTINVNAQNGSITDGMLVSNAGDTLNINSAQTNITTTGNNAYGIQLQNSGTGANVNINGPVSIETFGPTSHGFYLANGAVYTFDGASNHQLPSFIIHGLNSAVLDANGTNSLVTLTNNVALNMSMTPVAGSWGAKAEAAGRVLLMAMPVLGVQGCGPVVVL